MAKERVQKILARAGIASRRKAEELIVEGAVTINGKVAQLGDQAEWGQDAIKVNGKLLRSTEAPVYLSFYKPKGVISMFGDPEGRPSLTEYLGTVRTRLFPVGRLDFNSEGLIVLTNDGDFAEKVQRRDDIIRVYHVKVKGHPNAEMLKRLERGAKVGHRMVKPESIKLTKEYTAKAQIEVVLLGAGAIDLKAFFELKGFLVERITRVAFGHLRLSGMRPGEFRHLKDTQAQAILEQPELGMKRQEHEEERMRLPEVRSGQKVPDEEIRGEKPIRRPGQKVIKKPSSRSAAKKPSRGEFSRDFRGSRETRELRGSKDERSGESRFRDFSAKKREFRSPFSKGPKGRGPGSSRGRGPSSGGDTGGAPRGRIMVRQKRR
jgi:pseudouridine synthase